MDSKLVVELRSLVGEARKVRYQIQVKSPGWAGYGLRVGWQPAITGTLNQTQGLTDEAASTFDSRKEAEQVLRDLVLPQNPEKTRIVKVTRLGTFEGVSEASAPGQKSGRMKAQLITAMKGVDDAILEVLGKLPDKKVVARLEKTMELMRVLAQEASELVSPDDPEKLLLTQSQSDAIERVADIDIGVVTSALEEVENTIKSMRYSLSGVYKELGK